MYRCTAGSGAKTACHESENAHCSSVGLLLKSPTPLSMFHGMFFCPYLQQSASAQCVLCTAPVAPKHYISYLGIQASRKCPNSQCKTLLDCPAGQRLLYREIYDGKGIAAWHSCSWLLRAIGCTNGCSEGVLLLSILCTPAQLRAHSQMLAFSLWINYVDPASIYGHTWSYVASQDQVACFTSFVKRYLYVQQSPQGGIAGPALENLTYKQVAS